MMIIYLVSQIEDEYMDFAYDDVPRIYKKKVKAMLEANGNGDLAQKGARNYVGPRPPKTLEDYMPGVTKKDTEGK